MLESSLPARLTQYNIAVRIANGEAILQIRISTKLLALASPVFRAMVGDHFAKGQLPFSEEENPLTVVLLAEDDPDAVPNYCKIIHHAQDAQFPVSFLEPFVI
jgi:hypothetical protein